MIRLLIGLIVALFASVGAALWLKEDPGYVLLSVGNLTVETSVAAAIVAFIVCFVVLYIVVRFLGHLMRLPRQSRIANRRRHQRGAFRDLGKGTKELAEERWTAAEVSLTRSVEYSERPALHYIGAARAAHQLGAEWRRDDYLRKAEDEAGRDALFVGLAQAEFLLEENKADEAKALLLPLYHNHPRQPRLLKLLAQSHETLGEWHSLKEILSRIESSKALNEEQYRALQYKVYQGLLADATQQGSLADLKAIWSEVPRPLAMDESLLIEQASHLRYNNAIEDAEKLLVNALGNKWSEKLVVGFGELGRGNAAQQLKTAEGWLVEHSKDPYLLLTLGRLARRAHQLDKARAYLEESIKLLPSPDTYHELGGVLDEMNEAESANQCYRTGLRLLSGQLEEKTDVEVLPSADVKELALTKEKEAAPETN